MAFHNIEKKRISLDDLSGTSSACGYEYMLNWTSNNLILKYLRKSLCEQYLQLTAINLGSYSLGFSFYLGFKAIRRCIESFLGASIPSSLLDQDHQTCRKEVLHNTEHELRSWYFHHIISSLRNSIQKSVFIESEDSEGISNNTTASCLRLKLCHKTENTWRNLSPCHTPRLEFSKFDRSLTWKCCPNPWF